MDLTREGFRRQAWKQPLFPKPSQVMWPCSPAREAACPRGRGCGFGEQVAVVSAHSLETVKSNFPKEVTFRRRPETEIKGMMAGVWCSFGWGPQAQLLSRQHQHLVGRMARAHSPPPSIPGVLHL